MCIRDRQYTAGSERSQSYCYGSNREALFYIPYITGAKQYKREKCAQQYTAGPERSQSYCYGSNREALFYIPYITEAKQYKRCLLYTSKLHY